MRIYIWINARPPIKFLAHHPVDKANMSFSASGVPDLTADRQLYLKIDVRCPHMSHEYSSMIQDLRTDTNRSPRRFSRIVRVHVEGHRSQ